MPQKIALPERDVLQAAAHARKIDEPASLEHAVLQADPEMHPCAQLRPLEAAVFKLRLVRLNVGKPAIDELALPEARPAPFRRREVAAFENDLVQAARSEERRVGKEWRCGGARW